MDFLRHHLLTGLIFTPLLGAIAILAIPRRLAIRWTALGVTLTITLSSLLLPALYDWRFGDHYGYADTGGVVQMVQRLDWIPSINAQYLVGIDGLNLPLIVLTTIVFTLACVVAWNVPECEKALYALVLVLETMVLGTFASLDFFLFFCFAAGSIVVLFLMLLLTGGLWGAPRAVTYGVLGMISSVATLAVLLEWHIRGRAAGSGGTLDLIELARPDLQGALGNAAIPLFFLAIFSFAIWMPMIPFHGWFTRVYRRVTTPVGFILIGAGLNVGAYGMLRIAFGLFGRTAESQTMLLAAWGVAAILIGGLIALTERDLARLAAWCTISQLGFFMLGLAVHTQAALNGAMLMMAAQSLAGAALFVVTRAVENRFGETDLDHLCGKLGWTPVLAAFAAAAIFAVTAVPGLASFVALILIVIGMFQAGDLAYLPHWFARGLAIASCVGVVLSAACGIRAVARILSIDPAAPAADDAWKDRDLNQKELAVLIPLNLLLLLLGIFPWVFYFVVTSQTAAAWLQVIAGSIG